MAELGITPQHVVTRARDLLELGLETAD